MLFALCVALWLLPAGSFLVCPVCYLIVVLQRFCLAWWSHCCGSGSWLLCFSLICPGDSSILSCFLVYSTRRFVLSLALCYFVLVFFSHFITEITSLVEERTNLSTLRTFVRFALVWFCLFPLPLGVWEGLRLEIVALPELFSYLFLCIVSPLKSTSRWLYCLLAPWHLEELSVTILILKYGDYKHFGEKLF